MGRLLGGRGVRGLLRVEVFAPFYVRLLQDMNIEIGKKMFSIALGLDDDEGVLVGSLV